LTIYVLHGSAAMQLKCGGRFNNYYYFQLSTESANENIMKIG